MMNARPSLRRGTLALLLAATLTGCYDGAADAVEDVDQETQAIVGPSAASTPAQVARFALVRAGQRSCSATIIDCWHVVTAAHCRPSASDHVYFYESPDHVSPLLDRMVETVHVRPGVDVAAGVLTDIRGDFADLAVLKLLRPIPESSTPAVMAWLSPQVSRRGARVGAGMHDGAPNPLFALRSNSDLGVFPVVDGAFRTSLAGTSPGDDGGPFYLGGLPSLTGVFARAADGGDRYTSVTTHLPWVLAVTGYVGPFVQGSPAGVPSNAASGFATSHESVCAYACENTASCTNYVWIPSPPPSTPTSCYLLDAPPVFSQVLSAARHRDRL